MPQFDSGAAEPIGRFSEGLLLRLLHGKLQTQNVVVGRDGDDCLSRHHDAAFGYRHLKHALRARCEDGAL